MRKRSANVAAAKGFYLRESEAAAAAATTTTTTTTRRWSLRHFHRM
ncbi:hypothetical protein ACPCXA_13275 [Lysinibacillus agricola]